jgi:branched-subunit amino acid ABC-type transport system permease component
LERSIKPVALWALLGVAFLVMETYVFARWILSGPKPTPIGPDKLPTYLVVSGIVYQSATVVAFVVVLYYFVYRPWRRERRLTLDGMLIIALLSYMWQDPLANYVGVTFTYNANMVNFGGWAEYIPGWISPNGSKLPEPLLACGPLYATSIFAGMVLANVVIRRIKQRYPRLSTMQTVLLFFVLFLLIDAIWEPVFMGVFGAWSYPGAPQTWWLTMLPGHYFQFPWYEAVLWGGTWAGFAMLRYFRNDKGETLAERGAGNLRVKSEKSRTAIRLAALIGFINLWSIAAIYVPYGIVAFHQKPWIQDITSRSYLVDGLCGPGTSYACPSPEVPIPRGKSARVGPDGQLVPAN